MGADGRRQVFVFTHPREPQKGKPRPPLILAYLLWPGGDKERCCTHLVDVNGDEAKRAAIREHRENCLAMREAGR